MSHCPRCQSLIEEDFGLVTCTGCGSALFVELDGSVQANKEVSSERSVQTVDMDMDLEGLSQEEPVGEFLGESFGGGTGLAQEEKNFETSANENPVSSECLPFEEELAGGRLMDESSHLNSEDEVSDVSEVYETVSEGGDKSSGEYESEEEVFKDEVSEPFLQDGDGSNEAVDNLEGQELEDHGEGQEGEGVFEPRVKRPSMTEASSSFSDINEYGNSEASVASEGVIRFNVYICGIDSADILNAVKESLSDEKFMWDVDLLMKSIQNGKLTLRDVSSVKVSIIVNQLKFLPLDIHWEQYAIHQV